MKVTIVTDSKGKLLASVVPQPVRRPKRGEPVASLVPGPGQVFHEVDVPDHFAALSPDDLHRALEKHVPTKKKRKR